MKLTRIVSKLSCARRSIVLLAVLLSMLTGVVAAQARITRMDNHRSLAERHRIEFQLGIWDPGQGQMLTHEFSGVEVTRVENVSLGFSYAYWVTDRLATDITLRGLVAEASSIEAALKTTESAVVITSAMFGLRLYPISSAVSPLRPYISGAVGPYIGVESYRETDPGFYKRTLVQNVKTLGTVGGYVAAGLDIQMGRHFMTGIHVGYNVMANFEQPLGGQYNYNGVEVGVGFSLLLGHGAR